MNILDLVKNYSRMVLETDDMKKFHLWIVGDEGPLYNVLNGCCTVTECKGRTCIIGPLTFKIQGHYVNELSVKFSNEDDSTYVVLNTEVG